MTAELVEVPTARNGIPYFSLVEGAQPIPEREQLLDAAESLIPVLRERVPWVQANRRLPDETVADLHRLGLLNLTRPHAVGGYEADLQTLNDVITVLARGCSSTAWVTAIVNAGAFISAATLPEKGVAEIFDSGQPVCSVFNWRKGGTMRQTDEGYVLEGGEWPWASGSQISGWAALRAMLVDDNDQPIDSVIFSIPMSDVTVLDEWHTTAMRGTGSNVIRIEETVIPAHRVGRLMPVLAGEHLGEVPPNVRIPFVASVYLGLGPVAVGLARTMLEQFITRVKGKPVAFTTYTNRNDLGRTHVRVGEARAKIDAADLLMHRAAATLSGWGVAGRQATVEDRVRSRADLGLACQLATEAVNSLYEEVGASAIMESDPLSVHARDIRALSMHGANNPETNFELWGQVVLGLAPSVPTFGPVAMT